MRTASRSQRGFTLIECIVSIGILGLGLVAVSGGLTAALISNRKASHSELATAVAQDTIEEMRSRGFGAIDLVEFPASSPVDGLSGGVRTVEIADAYGSNPRLKKVTVIVSWRTPGNHTASVRLETVVGNRQGHTHG